MAGATQSSAIRSRGGIDIEAGGIVRLATLLNVPSLLRERRGVPTRSVTGERAMLGYAIYQRDMPGTAQVYDLVAAMSYNVMRSICGSKWRPLATTFARALPSDTRPYRRLFGNTLLWDQPATTLVFDRIWLDQRLAGSDAALHALLQREVSKESHDSSDVVDQVRVALRTMIPTGRATELAVAAMLTIPSRTLRRHLVVRGTSFRRLAKEVRYEIARQLLTDTLMPITEIAGVLEYADVSAFTRAFRGWTETSPAAWRARMRAQTQPAKANPS